MSFPAEAGAPRSERPARGLAFKGLSWIGGALATAVAVTLGALMTLVFAATLAVVVVLSGALVALYALTRRGRRRQALGQGTVIEARRVGHSWVAYGWDQRPR